MYLAAAGVGRIGLVDFDVVDSTNLQRQILYGESVIGQRKLDLAVAKLARQCAVIPINPQQTFVRGDFLGQFLDLC